MVIWSDPTKRDLQSIFYFIAEDSKYYAKKVIEKIIAQSEYLSEFPRLGRIVPEIKNENIRELIIYSYRMIYEIKENNNLHILSIIHGKQQFPDNLY